MTKNIQNAFKATWKKIGHIPTPQEGDYLNMLPWQQKAFDKLLNKKMRLVNAPMGSGKSLLACFLAAQELKTNKYKRCIIAVPQQIIANGFREELLQLDKDTQLDWCISYQTDLLSKEGKIKLGDDSLIKRAVQFLKAPYIEKALSTRILLCSHQTLVGLHQRLRRTNQLHLLNNNSCLIDEAHHVKNAIIETDNGDESWVESNKLGDFVKDFCELDNAWLTLMTATFFRGDRVTILPDEIMDKVVRYNLPYDEFFQTILETFTYDFMFYNVNPAECLKDIFKKGFKKSILHIPHVASSYSVGTKYEQVDAIIDAIKGKSKPIKHKDGTITIKRKGKVIKILDLVADNPALRDKRKAYIEEHSQSSDGPDLIIALGMFKEGANYTPLQQSIICGPRNSLTELVQMIGRVFRRFDGKNHIHVYHLIPRNFKSTEDEFRGQLNDYLKAIFASMLLEDVLMPNVDLDHPKEKEGKAAKRVGRNPQMSYTTLIVDDNKRIEVAKGVLDQFLSYKAIEDDRANDREKFNSIVQEVLIDNNILADAEVIADALWRFYTKRTIALDGIDVSKIDIDLIDPLGWIVDVAKVFSIGTGKRDMETFKALRSAISSTNNIVDHDTARAYLHKMRENGQPIDTGEEYSVWHAANCDYSAVEEYRRDRV